MDSKIIENEIKRVLGDMEQSMGVKINNFVVEVEDDNDFDEVFDEVFYIVMHEDDLM